MSPIQELGPNQEKWLHDLETTEEPQGQRYLCRMENGKPVGWCCLGRAVAVLEPELEQETRYHSIRDGYIRYFGSRSSVIPESTEQLLKLYNYCKCINMNDRLGYSFKQIAEVIRKDPASFFHRTSLRNSNEHP